MTKYKTTVDFIHVCSDFDGRRLEELANNLGLTVDSLEPHGPHVVEIAQFVRNLDEQYHNFEPKAKEPETFLGATLHSHIASDLRAAIVLILSRHNYQANIILRHLLESFVMTLWGDVGSNFKGSFAYLLETKECKPYRSEQRVTWGFDKRLPNRSIKERLERILLLNFLEKTGRDFYGEYLANASSCDLILVLSLPLCADCIRSRKGKVNYQEFHLDTRIRKTGKEDEHAVYRTDFGFICSFCGKQKLSEGFAYGIPEPTDMLDMLVAISEDKIAP